jgi:glycosyltransferase involved in cell wall biosynthesis
MKILWLSHLLPFPPQGGGVLQRSANLLKSVAIAHEVTLLAFNQKDILRIYDDDLSVSLPAAISAMEDICNEVHVVDIECDNKWLGKLRLALSSLFSKQPYSVRWLTSDRYKLLLNKILSGAQYDVIWLDTISLAQYQKEHAMRDSLTVLNHHNIESDMMNRRAKKERNLLKKAYFYIEAYKLEKYEKTEVKSFNLNITCSDLDLKRLGKISPGAKTHVIPNGVDTSFFSASNDVIPDPYCLVFIGGMSWYPNRDAMLFFARKMWPLLKKKIPELHMHVVGEAPPEEILHIAKTDDNYHVHGFVEDIKPIFHNAGIYVCPISDGGGTKLKILDALAMGMPIVAHRIACEGIDVTEGKNVLFAETPEDYVNKISRLVESPSLRNDLSRESIKLIKEKYSYGIVGKNLVTLLETECSNTTN